MADKFVAKRTDISGSGAANGDVIYLTDQEEVYDVVNTKLTLVPGNAIKISSGLWAVLNRVKTLDYRLTKPVDFDSTKKYTKGSVVTKDGDAFIANADIAVGTTWATGSTGATWRKMSNSKATYTRTANPGPGGSSWGGDNIMTDTSAVIGQAGLLTKITFSSLPLAGTIVVCQLTGELGKRGSSLTIKSATPVASGATSVAPMATVEKGWVVGVAAKPFSGNGVYSSSSLATAVTWYGITNASVGAVCNYSGVNTAGSCIAGLGWDIEV